MSMSIEDAVKRTLGVLDTLVAFTPTTADDKIISMLEGFVGTPTGHLVLKFLDDLLMNADVVSRTGEERNVAIAAFAATAPEPVRDAVRVSGVSWESFIGYLPVIARVLLTILGKRVAA